MLHSSQLLVTSLERLRVAHTRKALATRWLGIAIRRTSLESIGGAVICSTLLLVNS